MYRNFMTALNKADRSALRDMVPAARRIEKRRRRLSPSFIDGQTAGRGEGF